MLMKKTKGFTLLEIMIVMTIVAILSVVAVPGFLSKMPERRLRAAAREVYSNLQQARLLAIKENQVKRLRIVTAGTGSYYLDDNNNSVWDAPPEKGVDLSTYQDVGYGRGSATRNWKGELCATPGNCSQATLLSFRDDGTGSVLGTVYLQNTDTPRECYAVTVQNSGAIKIRSFDGSTWY